jgi:hypothetical protein
MPFYHCTHRDLDSEDKVEPGNYGRKILEIGPRHKSWNREMVLENVRKSLFPEKPSRLNATFCCEALSTIRCYKSRHCLDGFLYEVELVDPAAPRPKGDFNAVEPLPRLPFDIQQMAVKYWQYQLKTNVIEWPGVECSEIVSSSSLRVLRRIT